MKDRLAMNETNLFKPELSKFLSRFEPYEADFYRRRIEEVKKEPSVVIDLYRKLEEFSKGGKKMRAFFVYLGYLIGDGKKTDEVLPIALAFEMSQNFLLIHDDIMDNSDTRRGKTTVHRKYAEKFGEDYGVNMAITLGDIASVEVFGIISESDLPDDKKVASLNELSSVLRKTAYGQALDVEYAFKGATIDDAKQVADLKSAWYSVVGPLLVGAKLADAPQDVQDAIVRFGSNAGLVFQFRDDVLGLFGEEGIVGKSTLSDMREGKNTVLINKARELASDSQKGEIEIIWGNGTAKHEDLEKIRKIVAGCGALKWMEDENGRLIEKARTEIDTITKDPKLQTILREVCVYFLVRES